MYRVQSGARYTAVLVKQPCEVYGEHVAGVQHLAILWLWVSQHVARVDVGRGHQAVLVRADQAISVVSCLFTRPVQTDEQLLVALQSQWFFYALCRVGNNLV